jgi:hypothetical protein
MAFHKIRSLSEPTALVVTGSWLVKKLPLLIDFITFF